MRSGVLTISNERALHCIERNLILAGTSTSAVVELLVKGRALNSQNWIRKFVAKAIDYVQAVYPINSACQPFSCLLLSAADPCLISRASLLLRWWGALGCYGMQSRMCTVVLLIEKIPDQNLHFLALLLLFIDQAKAYLDPLATRLGSVHFSLLASIQAKKQCHTVQYRPSRKKQRSTFSLTLWSSTGALEAKLLGYSTGPSKTALQSCKVVSKRRQHRLLIARAVNLDSGLVIIYYRQNNNPSITTEQHYRYLNTRLHGERTCCHFSYWSLFKGGRADIIDYY